MTTYTKAVARWDHEAFHVGNYFNDIEVVMVSKPEGGYVRFTDHEQVVAELRNVAQLMLDNSSAEITRLRSALAAKSAEVEGLAKDAERYRWLASHMVVESDSDENGRWFSTVELTKGFIYPPPMPEYESVDSAIDAAMEKNHENA